MVHTKVFSTRPQKCFAGFRKQNFQLQTPLPAGEESNENAANTGVHLMIALPPLNSLLNAEPS